MKRTNLGSLATAGMLAGLAATVISLPQARGELVYENNINQAQATEPTQSAARVEDRNATRQALQVSERAQATVQAQQPAAPAQAAPIPAARPVTAPVQVVQQPVVVQAVPVQQVAAAPATAVVAMPAVESDAAPAASADGQNMTKAEMLRRARMREELKNEDALQSRLEELRLRDEQRRTDAILGARGAAGTEAGAAGATGPTGATNTLQEQTVVAPIADRPGQPAPVVVAPTGPVASVQGVSAADQAGNMSVMAATGPEGSSDKMSFGLTPRVGVNGINTSGLGYDVKPHYAAGIGASVISSDNISFELGYTYAEYGVNMASSNPFVYYAQQTAQGPFGNPNSFETLTMKQNTFDVGVKLSLLGPDSKVRPFVGAGGAYAKSFINYSQQIQNMTMQTPGYSNMFGTDYELSQYLGYLSTGADIRMNRSMSIGLLFKYYAVLSSTENSPLNNYAMYGYGYGGNPYANMDKQMVGGSLARAGYYSLTGGLTFVF